MRKQWCDKRWILPFNLPRIAQKNSNMRRHSMCRATPSPDDGMGHALQFDTQVVTAAKEFLLLNPCLAPAVFV
jgi:hypothetical protein